MPESTTSSRLPAQHLPEGARPYVPRPLPYDESWFALVHQTGPRHRARRVPARFKAFLQRKASRAS